ncbi:MAG: hemolysin family protein [Vicinamibacterales bacterium]
MESAIDVSAAGIAWRLLGVLALVFANGFFVAAEFAIVTVRKTRVDQLVAEGHRGARAVRRAVSDPDGYIAATQLGITMASIGLGWVGEPALASMIIPALHQLPAGLTEPTAHSISIAVSFAVITALHIVLGELAPKTIALERAEVTALWVVKPTELFMRTFWPFIRLLNGTGRAVVRLIGLKSRGGHAMVHSEEELKMLVTASQEAGVLEEKEEQMLHRVFGFADLTAGQIMIPRTELVALDVDATSDEVLDALARHGYPRLPVYRGSLDDVLGILHLTDIVKALAAGRPLQIGELVREAVTVPETIGADDLLATISQRGVREAIVIDEYGGTAGMVTFESLMERIVGDLGAAAGAGWIVLLPDGSAEINGLSLVRDVNERFALDIDEEVYTTLGGYVLGRLGRGARVGDTIDVAGRTMRVIAVDGLRVARVWLSTPTRPTPDTPDHARSAG